MDADAARADVAQVMTSADVPATIVARGRRLVPILHFEAKYAKMERKNEIYAKNWVRRTRTAKSQLWSKVNGQPVNQSKSTVGR